jgi:hypothetical protein
MTDRFDAELEAALARPGISYSVAEKLKKYPAWARAKITAHAHQSAQKLWQDAANRVDDVTPILDQARDRMGEIERGLDDGSLTAIEAMEALNSVHGRVRSAERAYDAACATEVRADALHADPVGHIERLFDTYPGLADRRITIHNYLAELEAKANPLDRQAMRRI